MHMGPLSCVPNCGAPVRVGAQRAASATANGACEQNRAPVFRLQSTGGCAPQSMMRGCGRGGASAWFLAGAGAGPPGSHPAQLFSRPSKRVASTSRICPGRAGVCRPVLPRLRCAWAKHSSKASMATSGNEIPTAVWLLYHVLPATADFC